MDTAAARNAAKTMAVAMVVATAMAAVAATTMVVAATAVVVAAATQTAVAVAMAATMATAVATEEIRSQAAPHQLSGTRTGTTALPMAATSATTTPA
jgi:hypothetical protein